MTQETSSDTNHSFSAKGTGNPSLFPQVPSQRISKRFEFFYKTENDRLFYSAYPYPWSNYKNSIFLMYE